MESDNNDFNRKIKFGLITLTTNGYERTISISSSYPDINQNIWPGRFTQGLNARECCKYDAEDPANAEIVKKIFAMNLEGYVTSKGFFNDFSESAAYANRLNGGEYFLTQSEGSDIIVSSKGTEHKISADIFHHSINRYNGIVLQPHDCVRKNELIDYVRNNCQGELSFGNVRSLASIESRDVSAVIWSDMSLRIRGELEMIEPFTRTVADMLDGFYGL